MKPVKKANQRNAHINANKYTKAEYNKLREIQGILSLNEALGENRDWDEYKALRVFMEDVKDIKVVLDDDGYYTNVAIMQTGEKVYIEL